MGERPYDYNHALLIGMVWGAFMKAGIPAFPGVDDEGNYLDTLIVNFSEVVGEPLQVEITVLRRESS